MSSDKCTPTEFAERFKLFDDDVQKPKGDHNVL